MEEGEFVVEFFASSRPEERGGGRFRRWVADAGCADADGGFLEAGFDGEGRRGGVEEGRSWASVGGPGRAQISVWH